jgi:hypothetical protein
VALRVVGFKAGAFLVRAAEGSAVVLGLPRAARGPTLEAAHPRLLRAISDLPRIAVALAAKRRSAAAMMTIAASAAAVAIKATTAMDGRRPS